MSATVNIYVRQASAARLRHCTKVLDAKNSEAGALTTSLSLRVSPIFADSRYAHFLAMLHA